MNSFRYEKLIQVIWILTLVFIYIDTFTRIGNWLLLTFQNNFSQIVPTLQNNNREAPMKSPECKQMFFALNYATSGFTYLLGWCQYSTYYLPCQQVNKKFSKFFSKKQFLHYYIIKKEGKEQSFPSGRLTCCKRTAKMLNIVIVRLKSRHKLKFEEIAFVESVNLLFDFFIVNFACAYISVKSSIRKT